MSGFVVGRPCSRGPWCSQAPGPEAHLVPAAIPGLGLAGQPTCPRPQGSAARRHLLLGRGGGGGTCVPAWQVASFSCAAATVDKRGGAMMPGEAGAASSRTYLLSEPRSPRTKPQSLGQGTSAFAPVSSGVLVT